MPKLQTYIYTKFKRIDVQIPSKSIAVLPFVNMSNDEANEYFSDGITEEIINALTNIKGLKVIARTSSFAFKGKHIDARKVGQQLGVATLLAGSVRKMLNRVRISAQLIDTSDGSHYWSKKFDRELSDIFELEDEISLLIANEVRNNFGYFEIQEHLIEQPTSDISAYDLFLKGRYYQLQWTPASLKEATVFYNKAIEIDKNYAKAYYANLQCYGLLATWGYMPYDEALGIATRNFLIAKDLDTSLPEYPLSYVGKTFWGEWDFKGAHTHLQQVLAMNANHIDGLEAMVELFLLHGFFAEAHHMMDRLLNVDPISPNNLYTLANLYYHQEKYHNALEPLTTALNTRPSLDIARHLRALCLIGLNKKEELQQVIIDTATAKLVNLLFEVVNEGRNTLPQSLLDAWVDADKESTQLVPYQLFILANTEHTTLAFELLRKYIEQRRGQIINYRHHPLLKPLREHAVFEELHITNLFITDIDKPKNTINAITPKIEIDQQSLLKKKLYEYFEEEKPYLNPQLSLTDIADVLALNTNKMSYLINEIVGVNFNEFVNKYRLKQFKKNALNPKFSHLTLLALAYDSGFNSKSVFNTYFKKNEGTTPSKWVKEQG